jgi:hypothetical protein
MSTYQNINDDNGLKVAPFDFKKLIHIIFIAYFILAAFIVPTTGFIKFLFL